MSKVFISHSTANNEIVKLFVDFLKNGMGVAQGDIFCTSYPNTLPTGKSFIEKIREELGNCEAVIFLITDQYLKSQFCLAELGAAWALGKQIYPLLLVDIEKIEKTPLKGVQVLFLDREQDVTTLYDELCAERIIQDRCTSEYMGKLPEFIQKLKERIHGEFLLEKDDAGYYHTEVSGVRDVPTQYRCYKIKGHVQDWKGAGTAKTDWIMFRTGMYEELKAGDKIRFQYTKEEVKDWNDIGRARNIYPSKLEKES